MKDRNGEAGKKKDIYEGDEWERRWGRVHQDEGTAKWRSLPMVIVGGTGDGEVKIGSDLEIEDHNFFMMYVDPPSDSQAAMHFNVGGYNLRFRKHEFCLITGMRFSRKKPALSETRVKCFKTRVLDVDENYAVQRNDLQRVFTGSKFKTLPDIDAVRLCLLLLVEVGFIGHQGNNRVPDVLLRLVDDLDAWNR
ncbi:hypothetical protein L6452_40539 [Arctium lappa]|uniref:Uncharacterized protein n=1 Tax=Arctium lappa TaxID=4217 RepID=A0ACB8XM70_ARCLA|nr:hypothetical protein L6452_40539 [Arctium lappa]